VEEGGVREEARAGLDRGGYLREVEGGGVGEEALGRGAAGWFGVCAFGVNGLKDCCSGRCGLGGGVP
jgi:hypothetical protein